MGVRVQAEPFDVGAEIAALTDGQRDIGAIVTFTGRVRQDDGDAALASLTIEHYPGMTEHALAQAEADAAGRWPLTAIQVVHRIGTLAPGDDIVLVVTASRHRQAAFDGACFLMDYLKTRAPFWKKETRLDGTTSWVASRASDDDALDRWAHATT